MGAVGGAITGIVLAVTYSDVTRPQKVRKVRMHPMSRKYVRFFLYDFSVIFTARQHTSYAKRCISYDRFCLTVWPSDRLTVRLTVRHSPVSCQNDSSYDHAVFTGG